MRWIPSTPIQHMLVQSALRDHSSNTCLFRSVLRLERARFPFVLDSELGNSRLGKKPRTLLAFVNDEQRETVVTRIELNMPNCRPIGERRDKPACCRG